MPKRRSDTNLLVPWEVVVIMSSQQDLSLKYIYIYIYIYRYRYRYRYINRRVITFLWASPVWRQTGQAQKNGAHWLRSGTTCTSTRFFAKYTHFGIVFAGSAERGTLLLWNGVEAFAWLLWKKSYDYLKLKKNALFLRYSRRRFGTRAQLHLHMYHPHSVSRYANQPTTFPFSLNLIDFFYVAQ